VQVPGRSGIAHNSLVQMSFILRFISTLQMQSLAHIDKGCVLPILIEYFTKGAKKC